MKLSRTRLALSSLLGLAFAIAAIAAVSLLDAPTDPALAQSAGLRQQFSPPADANNPIDALRTPRTSPSVRDAEVAAPVANTVTAPAKPPTVAPAAASENASMSAVDDHVENDDSHYEDHDDAGEDD